MKQPPYPAPQFTLPDETNNLRMLGNFAGEWLVLYFYPQDDTPGCTAEACSLRDVHDELAELDAQIVGVSQDAADSHAAFKDKHSLNFMLLTDDHGVSMTAYGALDDSGKGKRKTFIINPDAQVVKVYDDITPDEHGKQILTDVRQLQQDEIASGVASAL